MSKLGAKEYKEDEKSLQFPTICHNANIEDASFKLYYYKDTKLFHCYTECGDTFNVFELLIRYYRTRGIEKNFYDVFSIIANNFQDSEEGFEYFIYKKQEKKEKRKLITLPEYNPSILNVFSKTYPPEWINEGITPATMDKFNILYSISQNKIIIPHYDINNSVAVCGSNFNKNQLLLLLHNCKVENIIIAFDKEYEKVATDESRKYFDKLRMIGQKYSQYCNFYYLADTEGLLSKKDSPIDKGPEVFSRLLSKKVQIRR